MTKFLGIDASRYQGTSGMSFSRLQALDDAGVRFGIFRASVGNVADGSAPTNIKRAKAQGWVTGTYHFLMPGNGAAQAALYAKVCGDGLAVLDVEQSGVTASTIKAFVKAFRIARPTTPLGCYTSEGAWRHLTGNMDGSDLFDYLWQARWTELGTNEPTDLPDAPPRAGFGGWKTAPLWQYGAFHVKGFPALDGDAWYGTIEELRAMGQAPKTPLNERPRYRTGYNAMVDEAIRLTGLAHSPEQDSGPAWDLGVKEARADIAEALAALKLADPQG